MADERTIKAALWMLTTGQAREAEVAELAGVDRQLVRYWGKRAGINDPRKARRERLTKLWKRRVR